ncbi:MAG: nucleic acid-binding protein [Clostridia bacterium]|nr:nucleic acid-binding protein [Clostridia bacterium]
MRKCLRCESQMVEDMAVKVANGGVGIEVREQGMFKMPLEKIKCAVCPQCGYVETYVEVSHFIKKLADKYE